MSKKLHTSDIWATGPVDGMNELHPEGSYVRIKFGKYSALVSRGAAEVLVAEIQGILNEATGQQKESV